MRDFFHNYEDKLEILYTSKCLDCGFKNAARTREKIVTYWLIHKETFSKTCKNIEIYLQINDMERRKLDQEEIDAAEDLIRHDLHIESRRGGAGGCMR